MRKGPRRRASEPGTAPGTARLSPPSPVPPSHTQLPQALGDAEVSSARARLLDVVPTVWLDQLLAAVIDLPVQAGERAVFEFLIDAVARILPTYAVGGSLVIESGDGRPDTAVVRRGHGSGVERSSRSHPTRLFPELAYEHVLAVPGTVEGGTLHLGSDHHEFDEEGSPAVHVLARAAMVLGKALPASRAASLASRDGAQFERRMARADKLATFGQVAAGFVHELNNPLTSIVAYSDYLIRKSGVRVPDDVERLRRINESAHRMLRFTRDLVSYARPSSGVIAPTLLSSIVDRAVAFCEHVLAGAGMRVERTYAPENILVMGACEQLVQVFVNLITNACQAAPASEGCLLFTTSSDVGGGRAIVVVGDNGSGIAKEHLSRVFDPFFTTKAEGSGTGLGLAIIKDIVKSHGGDIRVESQLGRGTRFILGLPLAPPSAQRA